MNGYEQIYHWVLKYKWTVTCIQGVIVLEHDGYHHKLRYDVRRYAHRTETEKP